MERSIWGRFDLWPKQTWEVKPQNTDLQPGLSNPRTLWRWLHLNERTYSMTFWPDPPLMMRSNMTERSRERAALRRATLCCRVEVLKRDLVPRPSPGSNLAPSQSSSRNSELRIKALRGRREAWPPSGKRILGRGSTRNSGVISIG